MTREDLAAFGVTPPLIDKYLDPLNAAFGNYSINNSLRLAHFCAQMMHESGRLRYAEELADGKAYEGRVDLGNTEPGDGVNFKGRGLIQLTGRFVYVAYGKAVGFDFTHDPRKLAEPKYATDSAGWFWTVFKKDRSGNNLNAMADADSFLRITYFVNGGFNGVSDRLKMLKIGYYQFGISDGIARIEGIVDYIRKNLSVNRQGMNVALYKSFPDEGTISTLEKEIF